MAEEREPHRVLHRWFDIKPGGDFQEVATSEPLSTMLGLSVSESRWAPIITRRSGVPGTGLSDDVAAYAGRNLIVVCRHLMLRCSP